MRKVKVKNEQLLAILKTNRESHREIFLEALDGYKQEVLNLLDGMIKDIKNGKKISHHIALVQPMDQTKEYDRAIKMLEMSVDSEVELDETQFSELVMDEWNWTNNFLASNVNYSSKAKLLVK